MRLYLYILDIIIILCATNRAVANRVAWLDKPHDAISEGIHIVSERFDRFFDTTADEEVGKSRVKVTTGTEWREGTGMRLTTGAGARIDLPRMERRLNLMLENMDLSEETVRDQDVGDDFSTGLRFLLRQTRQSLVHIDGGFRFSDGPILFGRLRLRRHYTRDPHMIRLTQYFQWYDREGFGEISRFEYEQRLTPDWLFHTRTNAEWGEATDGVEWSQQISLANVKDGQFGLEWFAAVNGVTRPAFEAHRYFAGIRTRYRLYRNWLYLDLTPGVEFDHETNFSATSLVRISIQMIFGKKSLASPERIR